MNVIVVDDQRLSRSGIIKMIDWDRWNLQLTGEYANGKEAYDAMRRSLPDIVITDVRMPLMNGMELVERMNEEYPETCSIIVSGYDDYEYVRKSVQLDVVDYILKPVDKQELNTAVERIVRKRLALRQSEEKALRKLRESFFYVYLGSLYETREQMLEHFHDIRFGSESDEVCAAIIDGLDEASLTGLEQQFSPAPCITLRYKGAWLLIVIDRQIDYERMVRTLGSAKRRHQDVSVSVGPAMKGIDSLMESVKLASDTYIMQRSIPGWLPEEPVTYENIRTASSEKLNFNRELEQEWLMHLKKGDRRQAERALHALLDSFRQNHPSSHHLIDGYFAYIFLKGMKELYEIGAIHEHLFLDGCEASRKIPSCHDPLAKKAMIVSFFEEVWAKQTQDTETADIMHKVKTYIDRHYCDNISLSGLAQQFYISPGYFSILFKQMFQVNFLEYLTELRMKHAVELLTKDPHKKIHEVAHLTGYQDVKYFRQLFKRRYGCTPQEFKGEQFLGHQAHPERAKEHTI